MDFSRRVVTPAERKKIIDASWDNLGDKRVVDVAKKLADGKIAVDGSEAIVALLRPYQEKGVRPSLVKNLKALADMYDLIGSSGVAGEIRDKAGVLGAIWVPPSGKGRPSAPKPVAAKAPKPVEAPKASAWPAPSAGKRQFTWAELTDIAQPAAPVVPVVPEAPVVPAAPFAGTARVARKVVKKYYDCSKGSQTEITFKDARSLYRRGGDVHFQTGKKVFELWHDLTGDALMEAKAEEEGPVEGRKHFRISEGDFVMVSHAEACYMVERGLTVHFRVSKTMQFNIWDPAVDKDREAKKEAIAMFASPAVPA